MYVKNVEKVGGWKRTNARGNDNLSSSELIEGLEFLFRRHSTDGTLRKYTC